MDFPFSTASLLFPTRWVELALAPSQPLTLPRFTQFQSLCIVLSSWILFPQISAWLISFFFSHFSSGVSFNRSLIILPLPCFIFPHHTYLCIYLLVSSLCVSPFSLHENRTLFYSVWCPLCLEQSLSRSSHSSIVEWMFELLTFYTSKENIHYVTGFWLSQIQFRDSRGSCQLVVCGRPYGADIIFSDRWKGLIPSFFF